MFIEKKSQFQGMFPDLAVSMIRVNTFPYFSLQTVAKKFLLKIVHRIQTPTQPPRFPRKSKSEKYTDTNKPAKIKEM